jgi:hypothetical protein
MSPVWYELGFYIPEDGILHSHRRENLKSYMLRCAWNKLDFSGHISRETKGSYSEHLSLNHTNLKTLLKTIYFLFIYGAAVEPSPLLLQPFIGLLYQPWLIDGDDCGAIGGVNEWQGKPKYSEETCRSAVPSTTDPT